MDPKQMEILLSVSIAILKMLLIAQKSGLLFRTGMTGDARVELQEQITKSEELLAKIEKMNAENGVVDEN